jgi:2Fe-2S ferredoxin
MPQITFITADGTHRTVDARNGDSVMQTAIKNGIPGIDADCGGACDESWKDRVNKVGDMEASMLDFAQVVLPNSRLSCQLQVVDALDGLVVAIPESQH